MTYPSKSFLTKSAIHLQLYKTGNINTTMEKIVMAAVMMTQIETAKREITSPVTNIAIKEEAMENTAMQTPTPEIIATTSLKEMATAMMTNLPTLTPLKITTPNKITNNNNPKLLSKKNNKLSSSSPVNATLPEPSPPSSPASAESSRPTHPALPEPPAPIIVEDALPSTPPPPPEPWEKHHPTKSNMPPSMPDLRVSPSTSSMDWQSRVSAVSTCPRGYFAIISSVKKRFGWRIARMRERMTTTKRSMVLEGRMERKSNGMLPRKLFKEENSPSI
mmetsp:Transcript_32071/g.63849  ORF Transcript_32071/g.63849 Transcript_32071/m.63849 type:complete len:276 (-) Transcript_32071:1859-2686(-)